MGAHSDAIEAWLASSTFEAAMHSAYTMARGGCGSFDRNISPDILEQVVVALHQQIPDGLVLPRPDRDFISTGECTQSPPSHIRQARSTRHLCGHLPYLSDLQADHFLAKPTGRPLIRSFETTLRNMCVSIALDQVLPDIEQAGIADMNELSTAIQVVFIQLAASADILVDLEQSDPDRLRQLVEGGT